MVAWHGTGTTRWRHGGVKIQASEAPSVSSHNLSGISVFESSAFRETAYFHESDDFRWLSSARLRARDSPEIQGFRSDLSQARAFPCSRERASRSLRRKRSRRRRRVNVISNRCCLRESCVSATSLLEFVRILRSSGLHVLSRVEPIRSLDDRVRLSNACNLIIRHES